MDVKMLSTQKREKRNTNTSISDRVREREQKSDILTITKQKFTHTHTVYISSEACNINSYKSLTKFYHVENESRGFL